MSAISNDPEERQARREVLLGAIDDLVFEKFALEMSTGPDNPERQALVAQLAAAELELEQLNAADQAAAKSQLLSSASPLFARGGRIAPQRVDQQWIDRTFAALVGTI